MGLFSYWPHCATQLGKPLAPQHAWAGDGAQTTAALPALADRAGAVAVATLPATGRRRAGTAHGGDEAQSPGPWPSRSCPCARRPTRCTAEAHATISSRLADLLGVGPGPSAMRCSRQ